MPRPSVSRPSALLLLLTLAACGDASDDLLSTRTNRPGGSGVTARVFGVGPDGHRVRAKPTMASAPVGTVDEGDLLEIDCLIEGARVEGNDLWAYVESAGGYVSDAFLDGPPGFAKGAPRCETPSSEAKPSKPAPLPAQSPAQSPDGGAGGGAGGGDPVRVDIDGPPVKPHVQVFADAVCQAEGECRASTYDGHSPSADLALDLPTSEAYGRLPTDGHAFGDRVAAFAVDNRAKYRIGYVIYRQRIDTGGGWRAMEDRGNITQNHHDHVHVSFLP